MGENVKDVREVLSRFFRVLKDTEDTWCQLVTGSTRFAVDTALPGPDHEDAGSSLALAVGFTRGEMETAFLRRLEELARRRFGDDADEMWRALTAKYGGLSNHPESGEPLYNTWDVLGALTEFSLDFAWANTPSARGWLCAV